MEVRDSYQFYNFLYLGVIYTNLKVKRIFLQLAQTSGLFLKFGLLLILFFCTLLLTVNLLFLFTQKNKILKELIVLVILCVCSKFNNQYNSFFTLIWLSVHSISLFCARCPLNFASEREYVLRFPCFHLYFELILVAVFIL